MTIRAKLSHHGRTILVLLPVLLPGVRCPAEPGAAANEAALTLYVSTGGNDSWSGRRAAPDKAGTDGPFATLERARDAIRALKSAGKVPPGGVKVALRGGVYFRNRSFELGSEDGGTALRPIIYTSYRGETARLTGAREVTGWRPVSSPEILSRLDKAARDKVVQADLRALGITDFGSITNGGQGRSARPEAMQVLFNDRAMPMARWPNEGWSRVVDTPAGPGGDRFKYEGDRPSHWRRPEDVWLYGYWTYDWADSFERVLRVDSENRTFITAHPLPVYGYSKGRRYFALNVLEELDSTGEWYVDPQSGLLYLYPPAPVETARIRATTLAEPLISLRDSAFVTFRGLTLEATRGDGVRMIGGHHNRVAGCVIRNANRYGVSIEGGFENGVESCDLYELGEGGVVLNGGDRANLVPGKHFAINNDIHHFARWLRTYRPGVALSGVGNVAAHNRIHDAPHSAIQGGGNDHLVEYNEIYRVCLETGDAGAFYMGRDFTQRGNMIRYNYFHDLRAGSLPGQEGFTDVMAVYLDDCLSGETIFGNIFYRAGRAAMIGGGRDNTIENNIFVDCTPAIHVDARGKGWASFWFNGKDPTLMNGLKAVRHTEPPYSVRYPPLARILDDDPAAPKGNRILRNICSGGKWRELLDNLDDQSVRFQDNVVLADPGFMDAQKCDFRLRPNSPAWRLGFKRIPVEKIGLMKDAYRKNLPPR